MHVFMSIYTVSLSTEYNLVSEAEMPFWYKIILKALKLKRFFLSGVTHIYQNDQFWLIQQVGERVFQVADGLLQELQRLTKISSCCKKVERDWAFSASYTARKKCRHWKKCNICAEWTQDVIIEMNYQVWQIKVLLNSSFQWLAQDCSV